MITTKNFSSLAVLILFLLILAFLPFYASISIVSFFLFLLMWVSLSQSFNIFTGLTGYVNFGFVVFYGLGAYGMTLSLIYLDLPIYVSILIGGVVASLFALAVSLPILRLRGAYFAIAMLGLAQAIFVIFDNWSFVNSATGFTIPVKYYNLNLQYYSMLIIAVITIILFVLIERSKLGLALKAIKQNEDAAISIGINSALYKSLTLAISAFLTGVTGGIAIWSITIIDPPSAFDTTVTLTVISMSMLGGLSTLLGPVIGASILYSLEYYLGIRYPFIHLIVFGIVIIVVVLAMPNGIIGALRSFAKLSTTQKGSGLRK